MLMCFLVRAVRMQRVGEKRVSGTGQCLSDHCDSVCVMPERGMAPRASATVVGGLQMKNVDQMSVSDVFLLV